MPLVWSYEARGTLDVVHLAGFLGAEAVDLFEGAVGWVIAEGPGAVLLDGTGLLGWSIEGQVAIASAAARFVGVGIAAHMCLAPGMAMPELASGAMSVHADLAAALAALEHTNELGES